MSYRFMILGGIFAVALVWGGLCLDNGGSLIFANAATAESNYEAAAGWNEGSDKAREKQWETCWSKEFYLSHNPADEANEEVYNAVLVIQAGAEANITVTERTVGGGGPPGWSSAEGAAGHHPEGNPNGTETNHINGHELEGGY